MVTLQEFHQHIAANRNTISKKLTRMLSRNGGYVDHYELDDIMSDRLLDLTEKMSSSLVSFETMELACNYYEKAVSSRYKNVWTNSNRTYSDDALDYLYSDDPDPLEQLIQQEEAEHVDNLAEWIDQWVYSRYPLLHYGIFICHVKFRMTYAELAETTGIMKYMVGMIVRQIRRDLKEYVEANGITFEQ